MPLDNLLIIEGNLRDAYNRCVPGTVSCADDIQNARRTNPLLRNLSLLSGDCNLYSIDNGVPTWRICRETTEVNGQRVLLNPVFKNTAQVYQEFLRTGRSPQLYPNGPAYNDLVSLDNYHVSAEDFEAVKAARDTVAINLTKLRLKEYRAEELRFLGEWSAFVIRTADGYIRTKKGYEAPNDDEQKAMTRLGYTLENLKMFHDAGITDTSIQVLTPYYVRREAVSSERERKSTIARASLLHNFEGSFYEDGRVWGAGFDAGFRDVGNEKNQFRGVRREAGVVEPIQAPNPVDRQLVRDLGSQASVLQAPPRVIGPTQYPVLGPTRPPTGPDECTLEI